MIRLLKYKLPGDNPLELKLPIGARIITVQSQYTDAHIWAEVDPEQLLETRTFRMLNTADIIPEGEHMVYIGTYQFRDGSVIRHLYETDYKIPVVETPSPEIMEKLMAEVKRFEIPNQA